MEETVKMVKQVTLVTPVPSDRQEAKGLRACRVLLVISDPRALQYVLCCH